MDHSYATETKAAEQYLLGEMTESQRTDFEEHFFMCPDCAEAVRLGTYLVDNARLLRPEQLEDSKPAGRVVPMPSRLRPDGGRRWLAPAGIAATLLVALAGYQNLVEIPALRAGTLLVTVPTMLKSTVRGEAGTQGQRIAVRPGQMYVPLEMDLNPEKPFPFYSAELDTPAGQALMQAAGEAPPNGTLQVQLPVTTLSPGPYVVVIRGEAGAASAPGPEVARFPIELVR